MGHLNSKNIFNRLDFISEQVKKIKHPTETIDQALQAFLDELQAHWPTDGSSFKPRATIYRDSPRKYLNLCKLFADHVLMSPGFRDLYNRVGRTDLENFINKPDSLVGYCDRIAAIAFTTKNDDFLKLFEIVHELIQFFPERNPNTPDLSKDRLKSLVISQHEVTLILDDQEPSLPSEKRSIQPNLIYNKIKLCKACFRFFIPPSSKHVYCCIHSKKRNEREKLIRLLKQNPEPTIIPDLIEIKSNILNPPDKHHNYVVDLENFLASCVARMGLHDGSIDSTMALTRILTEGLLSGNHMIETALWKYHVISNANPLKPGPKRNYDVEKVLELREQKVKWKEIEMLTGKTRQILLQAIKQYKTT